MNYLRKQRDAQDAEPKPKRTYVMVWSTGSSHYFYDTTLKQFEEMRKQALINNELLHASDGYALNPYCFVEAHERTE